MPQLTFRLRTLTPMITMGAANDRWDEAELRAASFRGVLRYWLRALLGNIAGNDIEKLQMLESQIMGGTGMGSPVSVRVEKIGRSPQIESAQPVLPRRHYLQFNAFAPKQDFLLRLSTSPCQALDLPLLGAALLLFRLGSVGRRSRRGGGDLMVRRATLRWEDSREAEELDNFSRIPKNTDSLHRFTWGEIRYALSTLPNVPATPLMRLPDYPIFCEEHTKVLIGPDFAEPDEALDNMWDLRIQGSFHNEPAFGDVNPRRASALHMGVLVSGERRPLAYHPVMTIFRSGPTGNWNNVQNFVDLCTSSGYTLVFGRHNRW